MGSNLLFNLLFILFIAPTAISLLVFVGSTCRALYDFARALHPPAPTPRRRQIPRRVDLRDEERVMSWLERHGLAA